jgi:glyoxalase family protein
MTFFTYPDVSPGRPGTGQATAVSFLIPTSAADHRIDRLGDAGVDTDRPRERLGDTVVPFRDPDGLPLELVARTDAPAGDPPVGPVPADNAIRGFHGVTLSLADTERMATLLEAMGLDETETAGDRRRFEADGDLGYAVDETLDTPGDRLVLPERLKSRREEIESGLPPLDVSATNE